MADIPGSCGRVELDRTRLKHDPLSENEAVAAELNARESLAYIEDANELEEHNRD